MPRVNIIAIDGGLVNGFATLSISPTHNIPRYNSGELEFSACLSTVQRHLECCVTPPWILTAERFVPDGRKAKSNQTDALEINGALRWISFQCNATFSLQDRAEAKKVAPDALLKKLGWYRQTKDGHANDAGRHVILTLLRHYPVEWMNTLDLL